MRFGWRMVTYGGGSESCGKGGAGASGAGGDAGGGGSGVGGRGAEGALARGGDGVSGPIPDEHARVRADAGAGDGAVPGAQASERDDCGGDFAYGGAGYSDAYAAFVDGKQRVS